MQINENTNTSDMLHSLDQLSVWPFPPKILWIIGLGTFFTFFDIINIGLALPTIMQEMHVSLRMSAYVITSNLFGYIIGSFLDSRVHDLFGRKIGLYVSIALFSIGSFCSAFSPTFTWLIFWRFIIGMGTGSELIGVSTYITEISPAYLRGKIMGRVVAFGMFAFACTPFVALALLPKFMHGWQILFIIGSLGGAIILYIRRYLPESPRWLISQGRNKEAEKIIQTAENYVKKHYPNHIPQPTQIETHKAKTISLPTLLISFYKWRILFFCTLWFVYYIGNFAWLTLATTLFVKEGFQLTQSLSFVAVASLGFLCGSLIAIYVGDKFERKWSISCIAFIWSIMLLAIGWYPNYFTIMICGFIATSTISSIIPIMYTYTAENFPTSERATCMALTDGLGHLGAAFCAQIIFGLYNTYTIYHLGFEAAFTGMALSGLLIAVMVLFGKKMTHKQIM